MSLNRGATLLIFEKINPSCAAYGKADSNDFNVELSYIGFQFQDSLYSLSMSSQLVEALAFPLMKLVFQVLGIPVLEREVNVLKTVRKVCQVVKRGRPGENLEANIDRTKPDQRHSNVHPGSRVVFVWLPD